MLNDTTTLLDHLLPIPNRSTPHAHVNSTAEMTCTPDFAVKNLETAVLFQETLDHVRSSAGVTDCLLGSISFHCHGMPLPLNKQEVELTKQLPPSQLSNVMDMEISIYEVSRIAEPARLQMGQESSYRTQLEPMMEVVRDQGEAGQRSRGPLEGARC